MLRRVPRVLLLITGSGLLLALPLSFVVAPIVESRSSVAFMACGHLVIELHSAPFSDQLVSAKLYRYPIELADPWRPELYPGWQSYPTLVSYPAFTTIAIPLWLLAFICLAWPVTSFILARRRRKGRGFEVEARPGAALPPPESADT